MIRCILIFLMGASVPSIRYIKEKADKSFFMSEDNKGESASLTHSNPTGVCAQLAKRWSDCDKLDVFIKIVIIAIIIPLFLSAIGTYEADFHQKQNLARAYQIEISNLQPFLNTTLKDYHDDKNLKQMHRKGDAIYPEWGLYHSSKDQISKFDAKLSEDIYDFYYRILRAEENRLLTIHNYNEMKEVEKAQGNESSAYAIKNYDMQSSNNEMAYQVALAENSIPKLMDELNDTISKKAFILI